MIAIHAQIEPGVFVRVDTPDPYFTTRPASSAAAADRLAAEHRSLFDLDRLAGALARGDFALAQGYLDRARGELIGLSN